MLPTDKSWQSRLSNDQDELAVEFVESLSLDRRLYKYDIAGNVIFIKSPIQTERLDKFNSQFVLVIA